MFRLFILHAAAAYSSCLCLALSLIMSDMLSFYAIMSCKSFRRNQIK